MPTKALVLLLAFVLLLLPFLTTERGVSLPTTVTPEATIVEATAEFTAAPTTEATPETTTLPTAEVTAEATPAPTAEVTPEATIEPTLGTGLPVLVGDAANGEVIFTSGLRGAPACINCHSTIATGKNGFALGPGLRGIHEIAATRVEGMSPEAYLENSIRHPADYLVAGFRDIMYASFNTDYSDQEIADLVAYLMTL